MESLNFKDGTPENIKRGDKSYKYNEERGCFIKAAYEAGFKILEVVEKIYDIKIKKEELKKLKLENISEIKKTMNEAIKGLKKDKIDAICEDIQRSIDGPHNGETATKLKKAIKQLVEFIEKGGSVDIDAFAESVDDESDEELPAVKQFKENFKAIHLLEEKIMLIEGKSDPDEQDEEQTDEHELS